MRALEGVDFGQNPDELTIRRVISLFAGPELSKRQRLQAAQKGMVTKKTKEIESKDRDNHQLRSQVTMLASEKTELAEANDRLKKDNRALKNLIDQIKLKIAIDVKDLLRYEDSQMRKALVKWFKNIQG
jgi:predicted RNase H-like nuclease (RuvC/YqgF family)